MSASKIVLGNTLKELRVLLCQTSPSSSGAREFVQKHYVALKKANSKFPILIRECSGIEPKLYARYDFGKEMSVSLSNVSADSVLKYVADFAARK